MTKFIIQPHGRLNDWVADEKGYFTEEGLDYELNVEGSRKNTPRLAAVDSPIPLDDNRFGAFERYAEGHGRKGEGAGDVSCACHWTVNQAAKVEEGVMWGKAYSVCEAAIVVPGDSKISEPRDLARTDSRGRVPFRESLFRSAGSRGIFSVPQTSRSNSSDRPGLGSMQPWRGRYLR